MKYPYLDSVGSRWLLIDRERAEKLFEFTDERLADRALKRLNQEARRKRYMLVPMGPDAASLGPWAFAPGWYRQVQNPSGDEELRALERAVAEQQPGSRERLGAARTRRGLCAWCGSEETVGVVNDYSVCRPCSAKSELEAFEQSRKTYTGYLSSAASRDRRWIETFLGFPLVACEEVGYLRSRRLRYAGSSLAAHTRWAPNTTWSGIDRWGRSWYGRNSGAGMVTGMRLRLLPKLRGRSTSRTPSGLEMETLGSLVGSHRDLIAELRLAQEAWFRGEWPDPEVISGGLCSQCGASLPAVPDDEIPYQFCSHECAAQYQEADANTDPSAAVFQEVRNAALDQLGGGNFDVDLEDGEIVVQDVGNGAMWIARRTRDWWTFEQVAEGDGS